VAAVCEAGALGFIGAAYLTPAQIIEASRAVRPRTARPFGINLFAPLPAPDVATDPRPALERVAPFYPDFDSSAYIFERCGSGVTYRSRG